MDARGVSAKRVTMRVGVEPAKNLGIKLKTSPALKWHTANHATVNRQSHAPRRVLIAGKHNDACRLANEFYRHFADTYTIVGLITNESLSDERLEQLEAGARFPNELPVIGQIDRINGFVETSGLNEVDEVLIADYFAPEFKSWEPHLSALVAPTVGPCATAQKEENSAAHSNVPKSTYYGVKRLFDIVFSLLGLLLVTPLLMILGLLNKAMAPGPVLFSQERVGLNGRRFQIYKLRTMRLDAEKESGPVLAQHRDPRCTPLGAFLRATKIDELPQLYNVLRGDMSLIGPRPERPIFVETYERYIPRYVERHRVKPGLTGLAQLKGDQLTHVNVKLHYDLDYVANCNFTLDLWLLARTPVVILGAIFPEVPNARALLSPLLNREPKQTPVSA